MDPAVDGDGAQERWCCHENGCLVLGAHAGERLDVSRVRAEHHRHAVQERHHECQGEAERVEQREEGGHHVGAAELDDVIALLGVCNHVLVRKFDALRCAFGTRTEQNHGIVVEPCR